MRGDRIAWLRTNFSRGNAFLAHAPFYYGGDHRSKRSLERVTIFGLDGKLPVQLGREVASGRDVAIGPEPLGRVEPQHPASGWVMTGHARFRLVSLRSTLWSCCC
jgi:hypothetical protein